MTVLRQHLHTPYSSIGHSFATQYFTISRLPCSAAALIVHLSHSHFFSSRAHLSNSSLFVLATCEQKILSLQSPSRPQRFILPRYFQSRNRRHLFTLNLFFKSPAREDLLINFLVSVFTSCKNFTSVAFNLGRMCLKQISSLFTIKLHTSRSPIRLFCALVFGILSLSLRYCFAKKRSREIPFE